MPLRVRQADALARKLTSLGAELEIWRKDSGTSGSLRLHQSQILRVTSMLCGLRQELRRQGEAPENARQFSARDIEMGALELHRMWDFFRSKFALRKIDAFQDYLAALDEFAWACYRPVRDAAKAANAIKEESFKEPPLVYLSGGWSPFAMPRNQPYAAESVPREPVRTAAFVKALQQLPVPVISVPWYQVRHLPDAVVVGHEVGHLIEDDLALTDTINATIRGNVPANRRTAWQAWAGEIFGDLYGQLATGPAFVSALAEVVGTSKKEVVDEALPVRNDWGDYPTSALRMKLNFRLLERLGFQPEATTLEAEWAEVYGTAHAMPAFDADLGPLADALTGCKFQQLGNRALGDVFSFDNALVKEANSAVAQLGRPAQPESGNVRALIAAGRQFFDARPAAYTDSVHDALLAALKASLPASGTRAGARLARPDDDQEDRRLGAGLLSIVTSSVAAVPVESSR